MTQGTIRPARFCTQCGSPAGPDQRWCTRCGAQLTGRTAPAPALEPVPLPEQAAPSQRPAGRGRGWLIAMVCAVVLAIIFAAGAYLLFGASGSNGTSAADATPPHSHGTHRHVSSAPSPAPSSSSPTAKPRPSYRCWSGRTARSLARCGRPTGERGLAWVFPGVDLSGCTPGSADRELLFSCDESLADGTPVTLHLSIWSDLGSAIAHYDDQGRAKRQALTGDRYLWTSYDDRVTSEAGPWKAALMYQDAAYSMSLYAPSEQARREAIGEFGAMRPRAQLSGTKAS